MLHEKYGKIMKITGLPRHKNLVFIFDPDEIEKVGVYIKRLSHNHQHYTHAGERSENMFTNHEL
jgi:hypothetical protein